MTSEVDGSAIDLVFIALLVVATAYRLPPTGCCSGSKLEHRAGRGYSFVTYVALPCWTSALHCESSIPPRPGAPKVLVLCIARHVYISEHIARFFARVGALTESAVGLSEGATRAHQRRPDVVVCEYDLLATLPISAWERDETLSCLPILAVSLTRRPGEVNLLDVNGVSGFLYLPVLTDEKVHQVLYGATRSIVRAPALSPLSWPQPAQSPARRPT